MKFFILKFKSVFNKLMNESEYLKKGIFTSNCIPVSSERILKNEDD